MSAPMVDRSNLLRLLSPRSIAFVGGRAMAAALRRCVAGGFEGPAWLVNPHHRTIEGVRCYPSVTGLPQIPDAALLGINGELTVSMVAELAARGVGGAVCHASGFAETGPAGRARQQQLVEAAGPMAVLGPNCYGLLNYADGVFLWPVAHGGRRVERGAAVLTQSGNFAYNLSMSDGGVPLTHVISVGNQAQLGVAALMNVLLDDPRVTAIGLHLEGLVDLEGFAAAAGRALRRGVPVVVWKTGVSEVGARICVSHTSALAGSDAVFRALCERLGLVRVTGPAGFLPTLKIAAMGTLPTGPALVGLTCSGGDAGLLADASDRVGLVVPAPVPEAVGAVQAVLPDFAAATNPLDFTTAVWGDAGALERVFDGALRTPSDAVVLVLDVPPDSGERPACDAVLEAFHRVVSRHGRTGLVVSALPGGLPPDVRSWIEVHGMFALGDVERGLQAWSAVVEYAGRRRARLERGEVDLVPVCPPPTTGETHDLDEWEAKQILRDHGLAIPEGLLTEAECALDEAARLGYPVAVKLVASDLPHKTEAGAVVVGVSGPEALSRTLETMRARVDARFPRLATGPLLIERMVEDGVVELMVGVKRETGLGLLLVVGSGGTAAEILADTQALLLPTTDRAIADALDRLRARPLLEGYRGRPVADKDAIVAAVRAVADYALSRVEVLLELDVNPLIAGPFAAVGADAFIRLARATRHLDEDPHVP